MSRKEKHFLEKNKAPIIIYCVLFFGASCLIGPLYFAIDYTLHKVRSQTTEGILVKYEKKRKRSRAKKYSVGDGYSYAPVFKYTPRGSDTEIIVQDQYGYKKLHEPGDVVQVFYISSRPEKARLLEHAPWWMAWIMFGIGVVISYFSLQVIRGKVKLPEKSKYS